ncbi:MAG: DEAD/DEAH box helicase [Patescibacteria group bacterium]|nr:DEAD/DEAH box helicase [Patescibacteria group bacterium]
MNLIHDKKYNVLIYDQASPFLLQALPEAKTIGQNQIGVPFNLHNAQVLRHYNYPVPPIITDENYDWPIEPGRKPLAHQKLMANFMVLHPRCFNLSDMGTMKTLSALWAADWLMKQYSPGEFRCLIVAPLSTLERVWGNAIFQNFLSRRTFEILHGDADARIKALDRKADFNIINFDGVGVGAKTRKRFELDGFARILSERSDIRLCIADEASAYKDARTKRHRLARLIIGKRENLCLMTGTPTPNAPTDSYGLAKLVNNAWGKSFTTFQLETMLKVSQFKWIPQRDGYDKARKLLTPSIRFALTDIWDGPEMTTQQRSVELTEHQKRLMAELKRNLVVQVKQGVPITATNEAAARTKFIQISSGAIYDAGHDVHQVDASPRLAELKEILVQAPGKCLVFCSLTSVIHLLYKELREWSREIVNGETSAKHRTTIFEHFQKSATSDPRILIADPGTMAQGLDLWQAQTVIWYNTIDKTELYLQANKRAHRPGQKFPVTVVQIVSNKLEQEIYRRLDTNTSLQGALLEMIRKGEI